MGYVGARLAPWFSAKPVDRCLRGIARAASLEGRDVAKANTPVETGNLREKWTVTRVKRIVRATGSGYGATWENDTEYAEFVDQGTGLYGPEGRPYLILPKKPGGTLHWVDAFSGQDVFAAVVLHPGSPGNHMVAISVNVVESSVDQIARPFLNRWARETERQGDVV